MWPDLGKPAFYTLGNILRNSISKSNSNTLLVVAGHLVLAAINIHSNLLTANLVNGYNFQGNFFRWTLIIRPAEQGCVGDDRWWR